MSRGLGDVYKRQVYDITYGSLRAGIDNLVIIDDSIVRGTTLRQSIIGILDRLNPKKIVIVSSSPQVRYPDYYGIDMAKMSEFIAFKAAVELLKERDMKDVIAAAYRKSKDQVGLPKEQLVNYVKDIYAPFTDEEISAKMVELLTPKGTKAKVEIVYQPLSGLHEACPHHTGDWYFSGNYPTPGGVKLLNEAFINYIEQVYQFWDLRFYDLRFTIEITSFDDMYDFDYPMYALTFSSNSRSFFYRKS